MEVEVQRSYTICDHGDDVPQQVIPLTIFDRFAADFHVAVLYFFTPPTPSNEAMIAGLTKALAHFPTFTAQLGHDPSGRPSLLMGGAGGGALVVEATVASSLDEHLPLEPSPELARLHPPAPGGPPHLLQVQLNRFRCGGLAIGLVNHHKVADAKSVSAFLIAWTQAVRGAAVDPLPFYGQSWLQPRAPPRCEFQHWGFDFAAPAHEQNAHAPVDCSPGNNSVDPSRVTNVLLHYSSEFISSKLKSATKAKYTTFETLLAHVWRKMTVARGLGGGDETMVRITVNGRPRLRPPVSDRFFGNLVLNACPRMTAKELIDEAGGLEAAAAVVHDAIKEINGDYVQSMVDFGELHGKEELVSVYSKEGKEGNVLSPVVEVDSWLRFRFEELDFGMGGKMCAFLPTWESMEGLATFLPTFGEACGVDVMVALLEEDARVMKKISHSLD